MLTAKLTKMLNKLPSKNGVGPSRVFLPAGHYPNLLDFLVANFPNGTRAGWISRMLQGNVLDRQGRPLSPDAPYLPNQHLYYYRELRTEAMIPFEESIIYQDDYLVVADKPHFLPVAPVGTFLQETLLVRLKRKLGIDTLNSAHRIDLETAGLVLFTIQPETRGEYQKLFQEHKITKHYEAIAPYDASLRFPRVCVSRIEESALFMQMHEVEGPANSETRIEVLETRGGWAKYKLSPVTGKKHQLRVHMNALNLPLKNDQIYPKLQSYVHPEHRDYSRPLQLLAKSLSFIDPLTQELRVFESKLQLNWDA